MKEATFQDGSTLRLINGILPRYSSVGSYPYLYVGDTVHLCHLCATEDLEEGEPPRTVVVNWEDEEVHCDGCGDRIECAYFQEDD